MNPQERWQVEVGGQIYEAEFDELEKWVDEGSLLRKDRVRRGSLRWIEAEKVPALIHFFNRKDEAAASTVISTNLETPSRNFPVDEYYISSEALDINTKNAAKQSDYSEFKNFTNSLANFNVRQNSGVSPDAQKSNPTGGFCCLHPETESFYFCETCANEFCKSCPKSYGGTVKICPCCGAMCKTLKETQENRQKNHRFQTAAREGFSFGDFGKSLAYPFRFRTSLIFGAIFYAFFAFGQIASAFGGVMLFAGLICFLGTNMLSFGILANVIDNFSRGETDADFMPNFNDFSIWDDVVHPFFLSIGVYLVSFGLFAAILFGGIWYSLSAVNSANDQESMRKAAGLNEIRQNPPPNLTQPVTAESVEKAHSEENTKIQRLVQAMQNEENGVRNDVETTPAVDSSFKHFSNISLPFIFCLLIALLWGLFYFPAACAVAGYTRSFAATLNISVGFDTIRRLGFDYIKILLMVFLLSLLIGAATSILEVVLRPLDMPMTGNIPLKIISGIFTFYFSIVFACILGCAVYKNADKLELRKR